VTGFVFGILSLRVLLLEIQMVNKAFQSAGGIDFFDTTLCSMRVQKTKKPASLYQILHHVYTMQNYSRKSLTDSKYICKNVTKCQKVTISE
jgi:hypothetical protein